MKKTRKKRKIKNMKETVLVAAASSSHVVKTWTCALCDNTQDTKFVLCRRCGNPPMTIKKPKQK